MDKQNISKETLANYIDVSQLDDNDPNLLMLIEVFVKYWEDK